MLHYSQVFVHVHTLSIVQPTAQKCKNAGTYDNVCKFKSQFLHKTKNKHTLVDLAGVPISINQ